MENIYDYMDIDSSDLSELMQCSICLDEIITPYSLPCSHNFCGLCFHNLRTKSCPTCRYAFGEKKGTHVNRLLECLLRLHIDDYDMKKEEQALCLGSLTLITKYKHSQRMYEYQKLLDNYLREHNMSCLKEEAFKHLSEKGVPEIELSFIIDNSKHTIILNIDGEDYICCARTDDDVGSILLAHKHTITHKQAMQLSILVDPNDHPFLALNINGKSPILPGDNFIKYLKGLDAAAFIAKKIDNEWDSDSSISYTPSDSSDSSDSDDNDESTSVPADTAPRRGRVRLAIPRWIGRRRQTTQQ